MRRTRRGLLALLMTALALAPALGAQVAIASETISSSSADQPCGQGDVRAIVEVFPVTANMFLTGQDHPGLLDARFECQYRVYADGETFTFCEDDLIVGGVVYFIAYADEGVSRDSAVADIELIGDRVWIDGVEQTVDRTWFKGLNHVLFGLIVYQQRVIVTELSPGDHVSVWIQTYPGEPDATATVNLHILPRAACG